jgi:rhomboid protease GluP
MYSDDYNASPFNAIPPVVIVFCLLIGGIELTFQAAEAGFVGGPQAVGWRLEAIMTYGFFDPVFAWMLETRQAPLEHLIRFLTYTLVHGGLSHAAFTIVFILAIGKMVTEAFSTVVFLLVYGVSAIVGALAYGVVLDTNVPLIGAYPAVYGLIGALTLMLFLRARVSGENPLLAFRLILALIGIQLFFRLTFGGGNDWVADGAGFIAGFVLTAVLVPDGGQGAVSLLDRIRRRR